ncbi:MAG: peptidylprolyl isomerase [Phycisphaerae bacterium]
MRIRQGNSDLGWIVLELDAEKAPITVANFLRYVDEGYYNGTIFHRVISDFMIQGGGYTAIGVKKTEGQHEPIQNESKNGLSNERGTISMARMTAPHTASSEFFINVVDNGYRLDPRPPTGWGYAVFGKVVEGMAVVDRIKDIETRVDPMDRRPEPEKSVPVDPPVIVSAQRVK